MENSKPVGKRTVADAQILAYMKQSGAPAFTANEIAEKFDLTNSGARRRLYNLVESGEVEFKKPGYRTVIFWLSGDYSIDVSEI